MGRQNLLCPLRSCRGLWVCDSWVSALLFRGPFLALMSPRKVWGSGPCTQQQADQWRLTFHSGPLAEKEAAENNAQSRDAASRLPVGECGALALLLAWDCGRDRERQWVRSPLLWGGGDGGRPGHGGKGAHPLLWRETRAWRGREPQPVFWSTGSSDATSHLSCHHIPRLEQGRRRVITPPMTDPVMESELHNNFLCDCYILLSHSSS